MTSDSKTLGNIVKVKFPTLGNFTIAGKADTGAEMSSLHADDVKFLNDRTISISCKYLSSENKFHFPIVKTVTVRNSDGETENRPVISVKTTIDGFDVGGVEFSINDRSQNEYPILIGQNALKSGDFVIDPNKISENAEEIQELPINVMQNMDSGFAGPDPLREIVSIANNSGLKCWEIVKALEESSSLSIEPTIKISYEIPQEPSNETNAEVKDGGF